MEKFGSKNSIKSLLVKKGNMSLDNYINQSKITLIEIINIMIHITKGVISLYNAQICFLDLNTFNIVLINGIPYIIDLEDLLVLNDYKDLINFLDLLTTGTLTNDVIQSFYDAKFPHEINYYYDQIMIIKNENNNINNNNNMIDVVVYQDIRKKYSNEIEWKEFVNKVMVHRLGILLKFGFENCDVIKGTVKEKFDMLLEKVLEDDPNKRLSLEEFLENIKTLF